VKNIEERENIAVFYLDPRGYILFAKTVYLPPILSFSFNSNRSFSNQILRYIE